GLLLFRPAGSPHPSVRTPSPSVAAPRPAPWPLHGRPPGRSTADRCPISHVGRIAPFTRPAVSTLIRPPQTNGGLVLVTSASHGPDAVGLEDRVPFPARLESQERTALLALGRELRFAPRVVLLHQREPSSHVLFLVQGWTKVTAAAANGYEALLALRGAGDVVGESAALTGRPRSATVTALEPVRAVAVEHGRFRDFLSHSPAVSFALLGLTAD